MFFVFKSCGGARANKFEIEMFQDWLPFTAFPEPGTEEYCRVTTILPDGIERPAFLDCQWGTPLIVECRLSPIHCEPLKLEDVYRCPQVILECEKEIAFYTENRKKLCHDTVDQQERMNNFNLMSMWTVRKNFMEFRLRAANEMFPPEYILQYKLKKATLVQALHPRVIALGTCRLSLLTSDLLQRICTLSVDA